MGERVIGPKSIVRFAILLFFLVAPACPRDAAPLRPTVSAFDPALGPEIEAQVLTIERLAGLKSAKGAPDPRLFGELSRLEEMLPRSTATRLAQQEGKRYFAAMVTSHSLKRLQEWPKLRSRIEVVMRSDAAYTLAMAALDRRLERAGVGVKDKGVAASAATGSSPGTPGGSSIALENASKRSQDAVQPHSFPKSTTVSVGFSQPSLVSVGAGKPNRFPFEQMLPGDIMIWDDRSGPPMVRAALALFAQKCTHTAVYLGETSSRSHGVQHWILEAQSPALGVRGSVLGKKWTRKGLHVSLGHVKGIAPGRAAQLAKGAIDAYGTDGRTPYHIWPPWDKTYTQEGLYCSQLLWSVYDRNGVDLDSNDWHYLAWFTVHNWFNPYAAPTAYFAVFPDEIKASNNVTWYYDQANL